MGLDQYLDVKTKLYDTTKSTGACGGIFPFAPDNKGTTEIGYWRKFYELSDLMPRLVDVPDEYNCVPIEIDYDAILYIIDKANEKLKTRDYEDDWNGRQW